MQRKSLPRPTQDNAQVKEYVGAVKRGMNGYYVTPSGNGWSVRKASARSASGRFETKSEAITHAKKIANSRADIVIQHLNGSVTFMAAMAAKSPTSSLK